MNPPFALLFSPTGRPAEAPAQLALITVRQFAEELSDARAADAVRARIDWKYALALELTDPGFDASVLSEFRQHLITGRTELLLFETMLTRFREQGLLNAKGRQRTDSTHVLAALETLNRLEGIGETLRHALNVLATVAPYWLQSGVPAVWFDRYRQRFADYLLPPAKPVRDTLATPMGIDGRQLLWAIDDPTTPTWLREVPAMQTLRQVWLQQFYASPDDQPVRWRHADDLAPAPLLISSTYDPDARYGKKRETEWTGDKVHVTETCDDETPHLITDVLPTPATIGDVAVLPTMQGNLATRQVTPREPIVDAGDVSADHLLTSQTEHGIDLLGLAPGDQRWQGKAQHGFAAANFGIVWEVKPAICPRGQRSVVWMERQGRHGLATVWIAFSKHVCKACASRAECTRAASAPPTLRIREHDHYAVLQDARALQHGSLQAGVHPSSWHRRHYCPRHTHGRSAALTRHRVGENPAEASADCRRAELHASGALARGRPPSPQTRPSAFAAIAAA